MLPYAPWLCWLIPILGAGITILVGSVRRRLTNYVSFLSIGASAVFSFSMIPDALSGTIIDLRTSWFYSQMGVLVDPLSVLMACVITAIGVLVTSFSIGYMREEPSLTRFWFLIQLFIGGYVAIVMADNLLFMFTGWELVGVCCTGLAAFWHKDSERANTGLKTFLVLHIADVLFLASILMIYTHSQTFNFMELLESNNWIGELSRSGLLFVTSIMFLGGAMGKSAQFPLGEWLPDALTASPSSFNALTECLAGPFIMARMLPIFREASLMGQNSMINFFIVMTLMGAVTALITALIAMVQNNIFRLLSYCISSVIGYMMAAFGLAGLMSNSSWRVGYSAGTFFLTIDAFVSALLFLTAAYTSYAVGTDVLQQMSGFKSKIAHRAIEVGALAVAGIPPLSGFWCTNWVQNVALDMAAEAGSKGQSILMLFGFLIFALLIIGGGITAFYAIRMMGIFFSKNDQASNNTPNRKPPSQMRYSLFATLVITALIDFLAILLIWPFNLYILSGRPIFSDVTNVLTYLVPSFSTVLTCVAVALGTYPAYKIYVSGKLDSRRFLRKHSVLSRIHDTLLNRLYIDTLYSMVASFFHYVSSKVLNSLEVGLDGLNNFVASFFHYVSSKVLNSLEVGLDGLNNFVAVRFLSLAKLTHKYVETEGISKPEIRGFSRFYEMISGYVISLSQWAYPNLELGILEMLNNKSAMIISFFSDKMRKFQTGVLSYNMLAIAGGTVLMLILIMKFGGFL